ncbi:13574_t:CDS:2, partial [Dentiscutata erythropus]
LQVSSIYLMHSQPISNSKILLASSSQVFSMCFAYSNSEILQTSVFPMYLIYPQPILDNENSVLINSGISDMNKDLDINKNSDMNKDSNMDKDQNIDFRDQKKLEIVSNLVFLN